MRLSAAVAALAAAGAIQEICLLAGVPGLGLPFVVLALIGAVWLWFPSLEAIAVIAMYLGLELVLPLQTGAGRYMDWLQHWQLALRYGGRPNAILSDFLILRTPLFSQVSGAVSAHLPAYAAFQAASVVLNTLWLWPATLWIRDHAPDGVRGRLLTIALVPLLLAYGVYTWPWEFAGFFLLSAMWLVLQPGRVAAIGAGMALAGACLVHPGALGYALGLFAFAVLRRRVVPVMVGGAAVLATQVSWVFDVTGGQPFRLFTSSLPARQTFAHPQVWLVSRLVIAAHSFFPQIGVDPARRWADVVMGFVLFSLAGGLLVTTLVGRGWLAPSRIVRFTVGAGVLLNWAIYPPQNSDNMIDALFLGVLVYVVYVHARVPAAVTRRLLVLEAATSAAFATLLAWYAWTVAPYDANLEIKNHYGARFFADMAGPWPGLVLIVLGGALAALVVLQRSQVVMPTRQTAAT